MSLRLVLSNFTMMILLTSCGPGFTAASYEDTSSRPFNAAIAKEEDSAQDIDPYWHLEEALAKVSQASGTFNANELNQTRWRLIGQTAAEIGSDPIVHVDPVDLRIGSIVSKPMDCGTNLCPAVMVTEAPMQISTSCSVRNLTGEFKMISVPSISGPSTDYQTLALKVESVSNLACNSVGEVTLRQFLKLAGVDQQLIDGSPYSNRLHIAIAGPYLYIGSVGSSYIFVRM